MVETKSRPRSVQPVAVRQPAVAPRKTEPTSPEPEALILEVDDDDADVPEIIGEKDGDKEDT
jgi:hypothetical protein